MKNEKIKTVLFIVFLLVALVMGLILVRQNQETRRGAYFAETTMFLLPTEMTAAVGENLSVQVWVNTANDAKVDGIQTDLCYQADYITPVASSDGDVSDAVVPNSENGFNQVPLALVVGDTDKCIRFAITSNKQASSLKSGMVSVGTVVFKAVAQGSGDLSLKLDKSTVTGDNPSGGMDTYIKVTSVAGANYTITASNEVTEEQACVNASGTWKQFNNGCVDSCAYALDPQMNCTQAITNGCDCGGSRCWDSANRVCVNNPAPSNTPVPHASDMWLNYRVAFAGVRDGRQCASDWKVKLTVLSGSTKKEYSNIPLTATGARTATGEIVYEGSLQLAGFTESNNVAVFFKGPKHLQVKYGRGGQTAAYNQAGGEITLNSDRNSSPTLDFSGYPMLAGDIDGSGIIDGVDFTNVKSKSSGFSEVAAGGYIAEDLDGSCQVNNNDTILLVRSLNEKQDQVY